MDSYILYSPSIGYVESDIPSFVSNHLSRLQPVNFEACHEPLPVLALFDDTPPSVFPYAKATSAYSAVVQLYCRSGQLDTALSLATCMQKDHQPWCCFGCRAIEDNHHIFATCPCFAHVRQLATENLSSEVDHVLQLSSLPSVDREHIIHAASGLFTDAHPWPSCQTFYYLGITPRTTSDRCEHTTIRVNQILHTAAIQLAGQIWGIVCCETYSKFHMIANTVQNTTTANKSVIILPSHLSSILPPTSYPFIPVVIS